MAGRVHTYYFGRLNLWGQVISDKSDFILRSLNSGNRLRETKFNYMFTDIRILGADPENFITGLLVKYKSELEGERVNEVERRVVEGTMPEGVVAKAPFILHPRSSIIAYRPIMGRLSDEQFRAKYARLFEEGHERFFVSARIDSINEEIKVINAIDELQKILWVKVEVRPTNPSNRPVYKPLDERLKSLEAKKLKEEISGGENGLSRDALKQDEAYQGILMAVDGYGTAAVKGLSSDNRHVVIRTTDSPQTARIVDEGTSEGALESLIGSFRVIWERIRDDSKDKAD